MSYYHTAQICLNGHIITDSYDSSPALSQKFCDECGSETITQCPNCHSNIRGDYEVSGICYLGSTMQKAPSYCYNCGESYPWTREALSSIAELLLLESSLSDQELISLQSDLSSLLSDTPKTKLVATKLKLALTKTSSVVSSAIRDILVDIASEAAKKIIFPS
ncbi:MAG: DUF2321 domain-containing protein [Bacillota bacterium]|nr:DUF2321 domain-containing protein [Bacillota bacterium]